MKRELAQWLVCPASGDPLVLEAHEERDGEVVEGELVSRRGRRYPVTRGVPRMLLPELADAGHGETVGTFSAKWQRAPEFGHEEKSRRFYVDWYLRRYQFGTLERLEDFLRAKRRVLDAGTGNGRDVRLYADHCPGQVFGIDVSVAIDSAYRHLRTQANVHLLQADLTRLPFPPAFFDFIACDQVLHHTRSTEASFRRLATHLGPGGDLSIYVYRKKAPLRELADDYLRRVVAGMGEEEAWQLSEQLTVLGQRLSDLGASITVPDIPALGIRAGTYDVQRFVYWHMLKCYWNPALEPGDSVITNFDWYRPPYAHRHTAEEVRRWFRDEGLEIATFDECDAGISVRGRRG